MRGFFLWLAAGLFCAFAEFLEDVDGANLHGSHAKVLDGGQEAGGKDGALCLFVLADDDVERRIVLRVERDDAVAEGDLEGAVLRLVEEAQRFFCRASDFLGIGDLDLLRGGLDSKLACAIVDGVDAVKVTRAAVREEDVPPAISSWMP